MAWEGRVLPFCAGRQLPGRNNSEPGLKPNTLPPVLNVCRSHAPVVYIRARPRGTRVFMYSNPRAHRVGRLLAFLIEPFILALAYARTVRHRICDTPRFASKSARTHTPLHIDYRCPARPLLCNRKWRIESASARPIRCPFLIDPPRTRGRVASEASDQASLYRTARLERSYRYDRSSRRSRAIVVGDACGRHV